MRTVEEAADRSYAYILCAFKSVPEITTTPALLAPLISKLAGASPDPSINVSAPASSTSTFVLLQNGIGIEDDLLEALSAIRAPGVQAAVVSGAQDRAARERAAGSGVSPPYFRLPGLERGCGQDVAWRAR